MPKMKATRRLSYYAGRAREIGDEFEVSPADANLLSKLGAVFVTDDVQTRAFATPQAKVQRKVKQPILTTKSAD